MSPKATSAPRIRTHLWLPVSAAALAVGCISAPPVAVVNQRTALEVQASADFHEAEQAMAQGALTPRPEMIPREALPPEPGELSDLLRLYTEAASDAELIDEMLVAGCIGEGLDGLLAARATECQGEFQQSELLRVVGRENLSRRQTWQYLHGQRPDWTIERVVSEWTSHHRRSVVCGGLRQEPSGQWVPKAC